MAGAIACPETESWQQLVCDVQQRVEAGAHVDDATWNAVMLSTDTDDELLNELFSTCPDPEEYDHYDFESYAAEMQSLVLGNLRRIMSDATAAPSHPAG